MIETVHSKAAAAEVTRLHFWAVCPFVGVELPAHYAYQIGTRKGKVNLQSRSTRRMRWRV